MPKHDVELKGRLMVQAEAAIDQKLKERKTPSHASLADIEQVASTAGQQVAQAVTTALAAESAAELPPWPNCPQCRQKMKNKSKHSRRVVTETGEVEVARVYYHRAGCRQGFFPLDKRWEITVGVYSPECAKQMVWVATQVAYEAAAEMFVRLARRQVPVDAILDATQRQGERLKGYLAQQAAQVAVERVPLPPAGADHNRPLGLSLDGGMLYIRGEGGRSSRPGPFSTWSSPRNWTRSPASGSTRRMGSRWTIKRCWAR